MGTEIIEFLSNNFSTVMSAVGSVTGGIITAIFLRNKTSTTEFEKIKAGQFEEVTNELLKSGKMTFTEYYKAKNFLSVAKKADELYKQLPHEHEEESKCYDFDWFIRFYESVGNISNEKMQDLWAKILAGKINNPSFYSLKTIDILKNIGQKEAELFEKICSYSIQSNNNYFIPNYDKYLEACDIEYEDIMKLSEHDLIYNDALISLHINGSSNNVLVHNNLILIQKNESNTLKEIDIKEFPFTVVGKEIATLINKSAEEKDVLLFAKLISEETGTNVDVHRIIRIEGNQIRYETKKI